MKILIGFPTLKSICAYYINNDCTHADRNVRYDSSPNNKWCCIAACPIWKKSIKQHPSPKRRLLNSIKNRKN